MLFFFFKQKTAYEMRISDWSSDVCSSDLFGVGVRIDRDGAYGHFARGADDAAGDFAAIGDEKGLEHRHHILNTPNPRSLTGAFSVVVKASPSTSRVRSEEHTSELQSLMRISYAVFCLKKKQKTPAS